MDSHKTTILYFIINALEILNELSEEIKIISIDYIMNNAVLDGNFSIILKII